MRCVEALIEGMVQGVGYRAWTESTARRHGLSGWVRNRRDGRVEALFCGPQEAVQAMLKACESGPTFAKVRHIATREVDGPAPDGFSIAETV